MKKTILLSITVLLLLACETGVRNQKTKNEPVMSGIVKQSSYKTSSNKIFSKSAQPGYYLQMAVFEKNKPSENYLQPLAQSSFKYVVLNHKDKYYVLIGPYISYNSAKNKVASVKSRLKKYTFIVQVHRP